MDDASNFSGLLSNFQDLLEDSLLISDNHLECNSKYMHLNLF